ncbi:uncharacterized protein LOC123368225 isoform X2 [Mauremys mutica]|uniref:uncharacterized protein LOC123368225 isoform X2 n=1 Tax=Mauremys mutica TaxID=74926 RepID=UPI001D16BDF2|nr:uncharacterized protein LOC123368225 isoform X2 [Mauremys mutica]
MQEAAARSLRRGLERLRPLAKNRTLRYGVPMMLLIIGGSFGLREFTQIRYDAQKLHSKFSSEFCGGDEPFVPCRFGLTFWNSTGQVGLTLKSNEDKHQLISW